MTHKKLSCVCASVVEIDGLRHDIIDECKPKPLHAQYRDHTHVAMFQMVAKPLPCLVEDTRGTQSSVDLFERDILCSSQVLDAGRALCLGRTEVR